MWSFKLNIGFFTFIIIKDRQKLIDLYVMRFNTLLLCCLSHAASNEKIALKTFAISQQISGLVQAF